MDSINSLLILVNGKNIVIQYFYLFYYGELICQGMWKIWQISETVLLKFSRKKIYLKNEYTTHKSTLKNKGLGFAICCTLAIASHSCNDAAVERETLTHEECQVTRESDIPSHIGRGRQVFQWKCDFWGLYLFFSQWVL